MADTRFENRSAAGQLLAARLMVFGGLEIPSSWLLPAAACPLATRLEILRVYPLRTN